MINSIINQVSLNDLLNCSLINQQWKSIAQKRYRQQMLWIQSDLLIQHLSKSDKTYTSHRSLNTFCSHRGMRFVFYLYGHTEPFIRIISVLGHYYDFVLPITIKNISHVNYISIPFTKQYIISLLHSKTCEFTIDCTNLTDICIIKVNRYVDAFIITTSWLFFDLNRAPIPFDNIPLPQKKDICGLFVKQFQKSLINSQMYHFVIDLNYMKKIVFTFNNNKVLSIKEYDTQLTFFETIVVADRYFFFTKNKHKFNNCGYVC